MYCIKCGVKLADTEKKCPLCGTSVYHPDFANRKELPLYPIDKLPEKPPNSKVLCGALVIVFIIPLVICFLADILYNGKIDWFGFAAGGLVLGYTLFALPLWFKKPNPIIFVPCSFVAVAAYLLYISCATDGKWFLSFALPVTGALCLIFTALVTLLRYLHRGKLYIYGGALMALGIFSLLVELLLSVAFNLNFIGWSVYPLVTLLLFGCLLIYLAINATAREIMRRKLFF